MNNYVVNIQHKKTGERISLVVEAERNDSATHMFSGVLFGYGKDYEWTGTEGSAHWDGRSGFDYRKGS